MHFLVLCCIIGFVLTHFPYPFRTLYVGKGKGKVQPKSGHEGPDGGVEL
jgi:hypothetical protein